MTYEFIGRVLDLRERDGESSRGAWKMWEVVLEHDCSGQYPRRVALNVWDEAVANTVAICKGTNVQVRLNVSVDAREHNGKWFNDLRAYRAEAVYAQPNYGYQQQQFSPPAGVYQQTRYGQQQIVQPIPSVGTQPNGSTPGGCPPQQGTDGGGVPF